MPQLLCLSKILFEFTKTICQGTFYLSTGIYILPTCIFRIFPMSHITLNRSKIILISRWIYLLLAMQTQIFVFTQNKNLIQFIFLLYFIIKFQNQFSRYLDQLLKNEYRYFCSIFTFISFPNQKEKFLIRFQIQMGSSF